MVARKIAINFLLATLCLSQSILMAQGQHSEAMEPADFTSSFKPSSQFEYHPHSWWSVRYSTPPSTSNPVPSVLLPSISPHAFFCRLEKITEDRVKFPFIFRLGDVEQVYKIERKPHFDNWAK